MQEQSKCVPSVQQNKALESTVQLSRVPVAVGTPVDLTSRVEQWRVAGFE
jgi:hypothetical protein